MAQRKGMAARQSSAITPSPPPSPAPARSARKRASASADATPSAPTSAALGLVEGLAPSSDPTRPDFAWWPIDRVRPWVQNPRKNARAVPKVADSIRRFGWGRPLVVNDWPGCEGELVIGHTAWLAAHELALELVPVRIRRMEPALAHALAIADNKLGEIADWDPDELGRIVGSGEIGPGDLAIAGFSAAELEALAHPPEPTHSTIEHTCPKCGHVWSSKPRGAA
jgi:hypothetical protein